MDAELFFSYPQHLSAAELADMLRRAAARVERGESAGVNRVNGEQVGVWARQRA